MSKYNTAEDLLERLIEVAEDRQLYVCTDGRLAYMTDPGDGIVTHFTPKEGYVLESELE